MATITVSNVGSTDVYCADMYCTIPAGKSVSTTRSPAQLEAMFALQSLVAAGSVTVAVAYTANEQASGLVDQGQQAVSATGLSEFQVLRVPLTAGTAGTAVDTSVYALNSLPYSKMRIVDAKAYVSAGASASRTIQVRSATGGAGTLAAEVAASATGSNLQTATVTASQLFTNGTAVGLFVRRSTDAIAGEVFITLRPEI